MPPAPTAPENGALLRSVGFWGVCALVLNGLIGAGIFGLPSTVADHAGAWSPVIVLLVGTAMLPIVLVMMRLAAIFDGTGGPILYAEAAFGKTAAFQIGWMQLLSTTASAAANVNLLADYAQRGFGEAGQGPVAHAAIVLAALMVIFIVNLNRTSGVARTLGLLSIAKLLPLALVVVLAVPVLIGDIGTPHPAATWSLSQAALLSAYAFTGFEGALTLAGEARNPRRDLPRALVAVFVGVALLYAVLTWGYVATAYVPGATDKAPLSAMAIVLLGAAGGAVMLGAATVSIFANVMNNMLFLSRRLLAMEVLGGLPAWVGRVNADSAVPRNAVICIMVVLVALSLSGGFATLAVLSVASRLIVYLGCVAALPMVERRARGRMAASSVAVIVAAAIACTLLIAGSEPRSWLAMAIAAVIGAAVFGASRTYRA